MRKRKATFKDIPTYYKFERIKKKGYMYHLTDKLTEETKQLLENTYQNIKFYTSISLYAPEQQHQCILIYDKCIN